jgi:predicted flap endonuclease-1-like 5' DNA nuclease
MSTLILQTALLLLGAYFLGAWLACVIRRSTMAYHADEALQTSQAAHASTGLAAVADQAARAPMRRADAVPVAPQMETIHRPIASPVAAPVAAVPVVAAKVAPVVAIPAAPVDSVTRFQDVLTGTQRPVATAQAPFATAPIAQVPASTAATMAATAATATVAVSAAAAAAKVLTPAAPAAPASMVPAAPPRAPLPTPIAAPATEVRTPVVPAPAAPFTIPTPGPTRTGVSLPVAAGSSGQTSAAAPVVAAVVVPPAPAAASGSQTSTQALKSADDLTRIRAIDSALHAKLHQLGVRRYADIAAWTPSDVARVSQSLGFQGRIEQENWIEQAQILSRGGETAFARRKDRGEASVVAPSADTGTPKATLAAPVTTTAGPAASAAIPAAATLAATGAAVVKPIAAAVPLAPAVAAPVVAAPLATAATPTTLAPATPASSAPRVADRAAFATPSAPLPAPAPLGTAAPAAAARPNAPPVTATSAASALGRDNLQRIGGINAEVERVLNVQGVGKYNQIASWVEKDTTRFDRLLGYEGRIARENWIEQAQILSRNGETAYSRQFDLQHGSKATVVATTPAPLTPAAPAAVLPVHAPAAVVAAPLAVATAVTSAATAVLAKAAPSVSSLVPEPPRPARLPDSVVDQIRPAPVAPAPMPPVTVAPFTVAPVTAPIASVLATPALATAPAPAVSGATAQSPATRTGELAGLRSVRSEAYSTSPSATAAKAGPDDLKRIRGVGVLIERKLNSMGINSYTQVANWTSAEIDRVSQVLDFKGKVERENWVEQARILSAGGQTEFSRRVDRGDDMNKPK